MNVNMQRRAMVAVLMGMGLSPLLSRAQSGERNVAPLGLEVGVATLKQAREALPNAGWRRTGVNKWNNGPMFTVEGRHLDIDGLHEALFIFSADERLEAVVFTMDKSRVKDVMAAMRGKYKTEREVVPFVGDTYGRYRKGSSIALVEAPHLSFTMEVIYATDKFYAAYRNASEEETRQRKRSQADKF